MSKERIGIIDADLIGRKKHRFPNLVCEKISGYYKEKGALTELLLNYDNLNDFDHVYISKVFTDTPFPKEIIPTDRIHLGGTGFYFDKAPNLIYEIEHHMPDYTLYDKWIADEVQKKIQICKNENKEFNKSQFMTQFKEYTDYSIGFVTRGCFRKCGFCVNKKYDHSFAHSPLNEFLDLERKKICLLDDNFLSFGKWKDILLDLQATEKPFKFKQGLDERLLTDERCKYLFASKYDGDYTFAFDNLSDYDIIHQKLKLIRKYTNSTSIKFYVLVGYEGTDHSDIEGALKRIALLLQYRCLPYVMRYMSATEAPWRNSKYYSLYVSLARWCNQPSIIKKMTFREFCEANQALHKTKGTFCSSMKAMIDFENEYPDIAKQYFDIRFGEKRDV